MICKNCQTTTTGRFCNYCGQKTNTRKLSYSNLLSDLSESVLQLNKGFLFTFIQLSRNPGTALRDYINGKRKNYYRPVGYLLISTTIYVVIVTLTDQVTFIDDFIAGWNDGATTTDYEPPGILNWVANHYVYVTLALTPIFSLATYLCFINNGYNYIENLVINLYISGHQAFINAIFALLGMIVHEDIIGLLSMVLTIGYCSFVLLSFFEKGKTSHKLIGILASYIIYLILSIVLIFLIMGLGFIQGMIR